jgi:hypothetical protein
MTEEKKKIDTRETESLSKELEENNCQPRILFWEKLSIKIKIR